MQSMLRWVLYLLVFAYALSSANAQSYTNKWYSLAEGLPQSQVGFVYQDSKSRLWMGTNAGGVGLFNGLEFITFNKSEGMRTHWVKCATEYEDHVWLGTTVGISIYFEEDTMLTPTELTPLNNSSISGFLKADDKLYIATKKGLYAYHKKTLQQLLSSDYLLWSIANNRNRLILGINDSVYDYNKNTQRLIPLHPERATSMVTDKDENVFFTTKSGVYKIEVGSKKVTPYHIKDCECLSLCLDNSNNLWVGTNINGVYKIEQDSVLSFKKELGLTDHGIRHIMQDTEGNMWFSTNGMGVLKSGKWIFTGIPSSAHALETHLINGIAVDRENNVWLGTRKSLFEYNQKTLEYKKNTENDGLPDASMWTIESFQNKIWVSAINHGLFVKDNDDDAFEEIKRSDGSSLESIRDLLPVGADSMWILSTQGIDIYYNHKITPLGSIRGYERGRFLSGIVSKNSDIWLANSRKGVYRYDSHQMRLYDLADGLSSNVALCVTEDQYGFIWVATYRGLNVINPENDEIKSYNMRDGLSSELFYLVCTNKNGDIMAGSNKGIDKINIQAYHEKGIFKVKHFDAHEGFEGYETNANCFAAEANGDIWFSSVNGVYRYNTKNDVPNSVEPNTFIKSVQLFGDEKLDTNVLSYDQNHLTFNYEGISLTTPEKVLFQTKLDGFDQDWSSPNKLHQIVYSYLPSGTYTFCVKAQNNDGLWNKNPIKFNFKITPPFWETTWFRSLAILAIVSLIYLFIRLRERQARIQNKTMRGIIAKQTAQIRKEKEFVEEQNLKINTSLNYAQRIQDAMLPDIKILGNFFQSANLMFLSKEKVSGDFYWFHKIDDLNILWAVVDCTGHGVPGAFMSMIGNSLLTKIVIENQEYEPNIILDEMRKGVILTLHQCAEDSSNEGMAITLCHYNKETKKLKISGAENNLVHISNGTMELIKVDRQNISIHPRGIQYQKPFKNIMINIQSGDQLFLYTDGYADQNGGAKNENYYSAKFHNLLKSIHIYDLDKQRQILEKEFNDWKGNEIQRDDVTVLSVKFE